MIFIIKKIPVVMILFIMLMYSTVISAERLKYAEIFDPKQDKVVKVVKLNKEIHNMVSSFIKDVDGIYGKNDPDTDTDNGYAIRIPLDPIVSYLKGDVNGDGIPDNLYLTGIRTPDSPFTQNITLLIQDGITGGVSSIQLNENVGYSPTLFLGDFTGDGVNDILIGITTGGSGGIMCYNIYSFINNTAQLLFDFNLYNEQYKYDVIYKDNYKVEVISKKNNKKYFINVSNKEADYLNETYDDNGKLKNPITGFVNPLSGLYPVDLDSNKVYELLAYQKIAGRYNADSLGYVLNTLKWRDNMFVLDNQNVAIFESKYRYTFNLDIIISEKMHSFGHQYFIR